MSVPLACSSAWCRFRCVLGPVCLVKPLRASVPLQVLVCTSTLAWGVNYPAHLVIIKGTEYFDGKTCRYVDFPVTDVLQVCPNAAMCCCCCCACWIDVLLHCCKHAPRHLAVPSSSFRKHQSWSWWWAHAALFTL